MNYDIEADILDYARKGGKVPYDKDKYTMPNWLDYKVLMRIQRKDKKNGY